MTPSPACAALVQSFESCAKLRHDGRYDAYMPTAHDVPTIGWGTTAGVRLGMVWTRAECDARFAEELARFGAKVAALIGDAPTRQREFDALVSLAYNIGVDALRKSTVLRLHLGGDHDKAARWFAPWNKQAGVVLNGLTRRRAAETAMYRGVVA